MMTKEKVSTKNLLTKFGSKVLSKKVNGEKITETFYIIDFLGIKKNTYVISSFGRVFDYETAQEVRITYRRSDNYATVKLLTEEGTTKTFPVHTLVASVFIPYYKIDKVLNREYVHNVNWDHTQNYYWNLAWRSNLEISIMTNIKNNPNITKEELGKMAKTLLIKKTPVADVYVILGGKLTKEEIEKIKKGL